MPKVSVILCAYNSALCLARAVDSVLNQTLKDLELIIVNDGSRDSTLAVASQYAMCDKRVTVVNIENGGLANARNVGLRRAEGEFIAFCDADDTIDADCYDIMLSAVEKDGSDVCIAGYHHDTVTKNGSVSTVDFFEPDAIYRNRQELFGGIIGLKSKFILDAGWNKLYRRLIIAENGLQFPIGELFEDTAFVLSFLSHTSKATVLSRCFYHYVQGNTGSITKSYNPRKLQDLKKRYYELKDFCADADSDVKAFCELYYIKNVYSALSNSYSDRTMSKKERNALIKRETLSEEFLNCSKTAKGVGIADKLTVLVAKCGLGWLNIAYCRAIDIMKTKLAALFAKIK